MDAAHEETRPPRKVMIILSYYIISWKSYHCVMIIILSYYFVMIIISSYNFVMIMIIILSYHYVMITILSYNFVMTIILSYHYVIKSWYHHVINLSYSQIIIYHAKITHKYKKYKIHWNITIPQLWGRDYKSWPSSRPKISLNIFLPRPRGKIYCYFILLLGWMPNNIFLTNIMCLLSIIMDLQQLSSFKLVLQLL